MDQTILVSLEIERGDELLQALDRAGVKISVAMWAVLDEYGDWRLFLAGKQLDAPKPRGGYPLLRHALDSMSFPYPDLDYSILPMSHPIIKELRKRYAKTADVYGMRPGGQFFGDHYIRDGFVYRIA
jgi:hypothetical protein